MPTSKNVKGIKRRNNNGNGDGKILVSYIETCVKQINGLSEQTSDFQKDMGGVCEAIETIKEQIKDLYRKINDIVVPNITPLQAQVNTLRKWVIWLGVGMIVIVIATGLISINDKLADLIARVIGR